MVQNSRKARAKHFFDDVKAVLRSASRGQSFFPFQTMFRSWVLRRSALGAENTATSESSPQGAVENARGGTKRNLVYIPLVLDPNGEASPRFWSEDFA